MDSIARLQKKLKPCPVCGCKAILQHDVCNEFDFGYSVGCPRAYINDGVHGYNDYDSFHATKLVFHGIFDKKEAVRIWNTRCRKGAINV